MVEQMLEPPEPDNLLAFAAISGVMVVAYLFGSQWVNQFFGGEDKKKGVEM